MYNTGTIMVGGIRPFYFG